MEKHKVVLVTSPESNINNSEEIYVKEVEAITKDGWCVYHVERMSSFHVYVFFKKQS